MRLEVARGQGKGAQHAVVGEHRAREYGRVVGDAHPLADDGLLEDDVRRLEHVVGVAIDVHVVREAGVVVELDPADVVDEDAAVDHHVVARFDVVADRDLDVLEDLEVLPCAPKDALGNHPPDPQAAMDALAQGRHVQALPEP